MDTQLLIVFTASFIGGTGAGLASTMMRDQYPRLRVAAWTAVYNGFLALSATMVCYQWYPENPWPVVGMSLLLSLAGVNAKAVLRMVRTGTLNGNGTGKK